MNTYRRPWAYTLLALGLLALLPMLAQAAEPSPGMELEGTETSPDEDIIVEHYGRTDGLREIWLAPKDQPRNRQLLYSHGRRATVLFALNEQWLIVNDYAGSDESLPLPPTLRRPLHRDEGGGDCKEDLGCCR